MVVFFCGTLQKVVLHLFIITKAFATLHKKSWDNCYFGSAECKCQKVPNNLLKADCSGRRLHTLPVFNTSVIWIDLSNNEISNISSGFPRNVSYINLSENNIQELVMHPFHRLSNLKTLNLERNMINITMVYSGLFADLTSLTELSLKGNIQNKFKPTVIKDDVFSELKSLETLKIDGPANVTFGKGFQNITMLQKLDLSGITGNCSFQRISHNMFLNMPKLTYVDVSACDILDIEEGAFGKLQYLEHLDVSHNKQLGFASLPNITHNLNKTSIRVLRGNGINCLSGIGTKILKRHFENLKHTNISEIYFEKNRLEQLEPGAFRLLPNTITSISFGENKLTQGRYILDYFFLQNIRVYNISVQLRPPPFPESIFEQCAEKTDVLHENKQYFDNEDIQEKEGNKYESMMNDFIGSKWNEHHVTFYIPKTLEVLYANMSRLYGTVPEFGINATGAREIYAQDNFLYSWDGPVHGMENIKIMDLSNNFCSHISKSFLKYARGLTTLRMSKNDIGKSLSSDMEGEIFKNTVSMKADSPSYEYDIMISYSAKELSFVLTDVIPRLENEAGFQLYIKDRDEPAGISCGEAIMEAIQKSKRVVCLVTKSFLKSTWQDYELNMSRMEAIEDRENLNFVHLIIFPDVCNGSISIQTLDLVRQECFSEYPEEECAFDDFWETLISHIKEFNRY
uniref:TIR domain-containing protein n=1 Tax=Magallana gigas TaxID=29159 RepID=A0A8W8JHP2_MAGGI